MLLSLGMAGFVANKLCPQLISLPLNFPKYIAKAKEVREILEDYDPHFESAGLDEAYLNITQYCEDKEMDPEDVVTQLRNDVHEKTKITISAGIAANAKIAKIVSNRNKPNGQFRVANDRITILAFMRDLPTRKVNGVGRVFERELDAIGVKTCGDIYAQRAYISKLFGEKAFHFLMQCYLGLGRTKIQPSEDYERKSVGTESTFRDMSGKAELRAKLRWIAEELEKDLTRAQFKGRTLVLKVKLHTYEVLTRQVIPPKAVSTTDDLYNFSLPILAKLEREIPGMKLRLMGLRCTNLVSTKKSGIDFFGTGHQAEDIASPDRKALIDDSEWEVWPSEEVEFESAARRERDEDMNELEKLSQEHEHEVKRHEQQQQGAAEEEKEEEATCKTINEPSSEIRSKRQAADILNTQTQIRSWACPVCARAQPPSDKAFNEHIDYCLSRSTIRDAVRATSPSSPAATDLVAPRETAALLPLRVTTETKTRGRGRPKRKEGTADGMKMGVGAVPKRQRLLFQG